MRMCGDGDGAAEFEIAGDFGNVQEHFFQISGDRDFFDRIGRALRRKSTSRKRRANNRR